MKHIIKINTEILTQMQNHVIKIKKKDSQTEKIK